MSEVISDSIIDDAVAEALQLNLAFLRGPGHSSQVPFSFTASPIAVATLTQLQTVAPLLGRLTQQLANDDKLIQSVHAPLEAGDPFFAEMLSCHRELHARPDEVLRVPLLLQRSDFMVDEQLGPKLVECNSIAAGMAPFGEQVHRLHAYLQQRWPDQYRQYNTADAGQLLPNPATANMANAIDSAARQIAAELDDNSEPGFLLVEQENEDNLFDQRLLERQLQTLGIRTYRRTFRQLHQQLSTGPGHSLQLEGCGSIHVVYLRAGYQYQDYIATDLDTQRCCDALRATRIFVERHKVAVNATIAQQLATSKRMQLQLSLGGDAVLQKLGFNREESLALSAVFAQMREVDAGSADTLREELNSTDWVLKNQGEGGGHCLFDRDILPRLEAMKPDEYQAWVLMQRLRPLGRQQTTLVVRDGRAQQVPGLVSELGIFTAHLGDQPLPTGDPQAGHIGYLVRSKPADVTEGGVHSGFGALDSLFVLDE
jgi:glutathione synthetase